MMYKSNLKVSKNDVQKFVKELGNQQLKEQKKDLLKILEERKKF